MGNSENTSIKATKKDPKIEALIKESAAQLENIMNVTPSQVAKDVIKKAIGRSVRSKDPMFWPAGMLMLGLSLSGDERAYKAIDKHLNMWKEKHGSRLDFVDDALAGYAVIRLYQNSHKEEHRFVADAINSFLLGVPLDCSGSIIYNPGKNNKNIFADGIGQATMFMSAYIRMKIILEELIYDNHGRIDVHYYSESDYLSEIGALYFQFLNYYRYGRDSKSGLIYHGYRLIDDGIKAKSNSGKENMTINIKSGNMNANFALPQTNASKITKEYIVNYKSQRQGLLGWGRAQGWLMMGLAEAASLEKFLGTKGKVNNASAGFSLVPWYVEMCKIVMDYQREDGGWSWQLQAMEGHIDMSATGMIAYSLSKGITDGIIDKEYVLYEKIKKSLKKAMECMMEHSHGGIVTDSLSSCDDFAVHYQTYGNNPWGQGAVLAAVMNILKIDL